MATEVITLVPDTPTLFSMSRARMEFKLYKGKAIQVNHKQQYMLTFCYTRFIPSPHVSILLTPKVYPNQ